MKNYWSYTLITIVVISVILALYSSFTTIKADSLNKKSDIAIGQMYKLNSDDPFEESITVKVLDVKLGNNGEYYIKYTPTSVNDSTIFISKTERGFKLFFTIQDE